MKMLMFVFGMMTGGLFGMATMCLLQINHLDGRDMEVEE